MADRPENIILVYLRRIDEKIDALRQDAREVKSRLGMFENHYSNLSNTWDRTEFRLNRIECRLDLAEYGTH
jgi:septation ring formation regulator EzrA